MSDVVKPMLAADITDCLDKLKLPVYVTPKLDGVRVLFTDSGAMSRSWKRLPNKKLQEWASTNRALLSGLDAELIYGSPTAVDVYRLTQSRVARADSQEVLTAYVFDSYRLGEYRYDERVWEVAQEAEALTSIGVKIVPSYPCETLADVLRIEEGFLAEGYEGCILRSPEGLYKNGRSTVREGAMLKLKRFSDGEARIVGMDEEMENGNEATKDAFGRTERSSHKANLKGKGRMGALVVKDLVSGVEFRIGTGFDSEQRRGFWNSREGMIRNGTVVKYQHFPIGAKDAPRFPKYVGLRESWDL